jgi:hypothetical protein
MWNLAIWGKPLCDLIKSMIGITLWSVVCITMGELSFPLFDTIRVEIGANSITTRNVR